MLIPTYNRPGQLAEALGSLEAQDIALVCEILVGDDSASQYREANRELLAASPLAPLVRHLVSEPPLGNYPNQWRLGHESTGDFIFLLHDDDVVLPGALGLLAAAAESDAHDNPEVAVWFGRNRVMSEDGVIDRDASRAAMQEFGKQGPSAVSPMWEWTLRHSMPPDCFLMKRDDYVAHMRGERDGNVGDWGLSVRLANAGRLGHFVAADIFDYRAQKHSITNSGNAMDVHLMYEIAGQLRVPAERLAERERLRRAYGPQATRRYIRHGERANAWRLYLSSGWSWRARFTPKGLATLLLLADPRHLVRRTALSSKS